MYRNFFASRGVDNTRRPPVSPEQLMAECVQRLLNFQPELAGRELAYLNEATSPQLQQGPQCGLVALAMAAAHILPSQVRILIFVVDNFKESVKFSSSFSLLIDIFVLQIFP